MITEKSKKQITLLYGNDYYKDRSNMDEGFSNFFKRVLDIQNK